MSIPAQAANARPPAVPVAVSRTPAAAAAATPCGPRIRTAAAAPRPGPTGRAEGDQRDQHCNGVEDRRLHAYRIQEEPVAGYLCEDRDQHQRHEPPVTVERAHDGEPLPQGATAAEGEPAQPGAQAERDDDANNRKPPWQPERADERERGQRGEGRLDRHDRQLRGDQRRHPRALARGGAPKRGDSRRHRQLPVEQAADASHARRPVQATALDRAARGPHAQMPRLGARQECQELQDHARHDDRGGHGGDRSRELVPSAGDHPGDRPQ
jgi:hypothetical protein